MGVHMPTMVVTFEAVISWGVERTPVYICPSPPPAAIPVPQADHRPLPSVQGPVRSRPCFPMPKAGAFGAARGPNRRLLHPLSISRRRPPARRRAAHPAL